MGTTQSTTATTTTNNNNNNLPSLSTLLSNASEDEENFHDWNLVEQVLRNEPEQACLYAHGSSFEPSPLLIALRISSCPVLIIQLLIEAHEDALLHSFRNVTVIHACLQSQLPYNVDESDNDNNNEEIVTKKLQLLLGFSQVRQDIVPKLSLHELPMIQSESIMKVLLLLSLPNSKNLISERSKLHGELPLHAYLAHEIKPSSSATLFTKNNPQVLQLLVKTALKQQQQSLGGVVTRDRYGNTPFTYLCRLLERDCIQQQQQQNYDYTTNDTNHETSSSISKLSPHGQQLWNILVEWIHLIQQRQQRQQQQQQQYQLGTKKQLPQQHQQQLNLQSNNNNDFNFDLHTMIEMGIGTIGTEHLFSIALEHYKRYTNCRTISHGRTILHLAVMQPNFAASCIQEISTPALSRMTDLDGRLPIDLAAEYGYANVQGLACIIRGEPRAVDTRDLLNGQYPFISAAVANQRKSDRNQSNSNNEDQQEDSEEEEEEEDYRHYTNRLSTTYYLLRAKPHVLSYFHLN